jgi:hypothetical protein
MLNQKPGVARALNRAGLSYFAIEAGVIGTIIGMAGVFTPAVPTTNCGTSPFQRSLDWASICRM